MSSTPAPSAVVFDWDNTLVDTWPVIHQALAATFIAMERRPWSLEETKQRVGLSLREAFPDLFGERWRDAAAVFYETFERTHLEALTPLDGALDLLEGLTARNAPIAVVSNKRGPFLRREVQALGWQAYFHRAVGAGDAQRDKPDPGVLDLALEGAGVVPGPHVWLVGDSRVDMELAHRTGCTPVLLHPDPAARRTELAPYHPVESFVGCAALLARITS